MRISVSCLGNIMGIESFWPKMGGVNNNMWYVIQTLKGQEYRVADYIRDIAKDGENIFVFENEMEYRIKGEWIRDRKPFFPGYIFVEMEKGQAEDFNKRLYKKKRKLLSVDGDITPIKEEEEDYLRKLGGDEHIIHYSEGFRVDDMVVITSGAFKGYTGEISKLDRHNRRARIKVSLLGRDTEVEIGLEIVDNKTFRELSEEEKVDRLNAARIVSA